MRTILDELLEETEIGLETETGLSELPYSVREALTLGLWPLAIQRAVDAGITDVNKLTNMIFFAAHPERAGRKISRSEPNFQKIRDEWEGYKDFFVMPIIEGASSTVSRTSTSFKPVSVESKGGGRITNKTEPKKTDLVKIKGYRGRNIRLHHLAAKALQAMMKAARADGIKAPLLMAVSGYRSVAKQKRLWAIGLKKHGSAEKARKWIAPPGRSPHHSGRAIDLWLGLGIGKRNAKTMAKLPVYKWMQKNAELFGFYPYTREPWHWEYNPPVTSRELELFAELEDDFLAEDEFTDEHEDIGFEADYEYRLFEDSGGFELESGGY